MAGFSNFDHSSSSYIDVNIEYIDECEERLKKLFDQALLVFLEEEGNKRPLPAVLGDGENVDLFKLFVLVRERDGFESVSRKGLWESVAEKLGFDCSVSPSLRLVYSKYLDRMEKWLEEKSRIVNWDNQGSEKKGCYGSLLHELGDGLKVLLESGKCQKRDRDSEESGSELHRKRVRENGDEDGGEGLELSCVVLSDESVVCVEEEGLDLSSKKQEDLPGMLKWLTSVATSPHDPSIGVIPHYSRWDEYKGNECWRQVTKARKALLVQREHRYHYSTLMAHQTLHPSMYNDYRKSTARLRYDIRSPQSSKLCTSLCCNGSLVSRTKSRSTKCRELAIVPAGAGLVAGTSGATDLQVCSNATAQRKKPAFPPRCVAVGPRYQAQVDEWTGSRLESDTKWLGTRVWPLGNEEASDDTLGNDLVGKGRPDSCSCVTLRPASVECRRFHIAENRMALKRDLGDFFFHWRFNQMGEEVSLSWTEKEEKRFKDMLISDPKLFWKNAAKWFQGKKRKDIVRYYFNVFLINKRRYQNLATPKHLDSDDDEPFGSVGGRFGQAAVASVDSDSMICTLNRQCDDFE